MVGGFVVVVGEGVVIWFHQVLTNRMMLYSTHVFQLEQEDGKNPNHNYQRVVLAISQHIVFEDSRMQELCLGYVLVVCVMLEKRGQGRLDSPRR